MFQRCSTSADFSTPDVSCFRSHRVSSVLIIKTSHVSLHTFGLIINFILHHNNCPYWGLYCIFLSWLGMIICHSATSFILSDFWSYFSWWSSQCYLFLKFNIISNICITVISSYNVGEQLLEVHEDSRETNCRSGKWGTAWECVLAQVVGFPIHSNLSGVDTSSPHTPPLPSLLHTAQSSQQHIGLIHIVKWVAEWVL